MMSKLYVAHYFIFVYETKDLAEISKNLTRYRSENNFVRLLKYKLRRKKKYTQI